MPKFVWIALVISYGDIHTKWQLVYRMQVHVWLVDSLYIRIYMMYCIYVHILWNFTSTDTLRAEESVPISGIVVFGTAICVLYIEVS